MTETKSCTRKTFLKTVGVGTCCMLLAPSALTSGQKQVPRGKVILGPASELLKKEGTTIFAKQQIILEVTSAKVRAMSARCPHMGCSVVQEGSLFKCPCHGSKFDKMGRVKKGPAKADLPFLGIEVDQGGFLVIDQDKPSSDSKNAWELIAPLMMEQEEEV